MKIFHQAIENAKPIIGVQTIKRGGKSYQVRSNYRVLVIKLMYI